LTGIENLIGGGGADLLIGNGEANWLDGGAGADQLEGGDGADVLIGGAGRDVLMGGRGGDTFLFAAIKEFSGASTSAADVITDFASAQRDRIDLSGVDAIKSTATVNDAFTWIGTAAFSKKSGELRYTASGESGPGERGYRRQRDRRFRHPPRQGSCPHRSGFRALSR